MTPSTTFAATWDRTVLAHGDRPFLLFRDLDGTVTEWTYGQFDQIAAQVAGRLATHGVRPGDRVHLVLRNCPAFVALWLAASRLGATMVPVDPSSTARDVARQVRHTGPALVVCSEENAEVVAEALAGDRRRVVVVTGTAQDLGRRSALLGTATASADPAPQDRIAIMFTSGTTSEPKGVELTQANYAHVAATMARLAGLGPEHRWYVCLPLFHANAQYYCFAPAIAVGASVALTARFTASRWPHEVAELGATHASLFAAPIRMILARRRDDAPRLSLAHVWFAQNLAHGQWQEMTELCGVAPRQVYGMTETIAVVTASPIDRAHPARIGEVVASREVRLLDTLTGEPVADGRPGVLTVCGERGVDLFAGYRNRPEAEQGAFTTDAAGTWFTTGDLVTRCDDGHLAFVGRIDDVVKVSGENVSLTRIEAAIAEAPGVLEAAVIAEPDPIRDLVPVAFVVAREPARAPSVADLTTWATTHLTGAERPHRWTIVEALPRTSVGKIRRFQLTTREHIETGSRSAGRRSAGPAIA